jgi:hypothetical protein
MTGKAQFHFGVWDWFQGFAIPNENAQPGGTICGQVRLTQNDGFLRLGFTDGYVNGEPNDSQDEQCYGEPDLPSDAASGFGRIFCLTIGHSVHCVHEPPPDYSSASLPSCYRDVQHRDSLIGPSWG